MWRSAQEYTVRTGQNGFDLSPYHLYIRLRALDDIEARNRDTTFRATLSAIAMAFGDNEAAKGLM